MWFMVYWKSIQSFLEVRRISICLMALLFCMPVYAQTKRALLIGISEYLQNGEGSWTNIHGANDLDLLSSILKEQGYKTKLVKNKYAKAAYLRKQLDLLLTSCKRGDYVYIHFSGHGQPVEDLNGDEEDGWDEAIVPYDAKMFFRTGQYEGENHILDDELSVYLNRIRTAISANGFLCVVIDACHAGGSSRGEDDEDEEPICRGTKTGFSPNGKTYSPRFNEKGNFKIEQSANQSNILIIEACRSYQCNA